MLTQWRLLPFWLVQWSGHCSHMRIPLHSPWLPGSVDVVQTLLIILTVVGYFSRETWYMSVYVYICTHTFLKNYWFKRVREKYWSLVPLVFAFIGWFLYVPWPGIEPSTLVYGYDTVTNGATCPGPLFLFLFLISCLVFKGLLKCVVIPLSEKN